MLKGISEILIEDAEPFELTPEQEAEVERQLILAEQDDAMNAPVNVNFRWRKNALDIVKQAADTMGVGYQNYLKQAAYRQAVTDLHTLAQIKETEKPKEALQR